MRKIPRRTRKGSALFAFREGRFFNFCKKLSCAWRAIVAKTMV